jgi:hypothetical protein
VGVDITTGVGLDGALAGSSAVIDVSNVSTANRNRAITFFEIGTRNLLAAGRRVGITHHVALSIVDVDRVDLGYYQGKQHQEALVLAAGPQVLEMPELVRQLLRSRGSRRIVLPIRVPGAAGRAMASGGLLPTGPGPRGRQTFTDWLADANRTNRTNRNGGAHQAGGAPGPGSRDARRGVRHLDAPGSSGTSIGACQSRSVSPSSPETALVQKSSRRA